MYGGEGNGMFAGAGGGPMESSLKEFLSRPEHAAMLEKQQQKEFKQAMQLKEKIRALEFRNKVLESDYDAQKNVAPFLKSKMLRRIVQTFTNDESGDFEKWANNPRVVEMLREAQRQLDEGRTTEEELEELMLRQLRDPACEAHEEFKAKTKMGARLGTDHLVGALNEHLTERRKGNNAYREGDYNKALHFYERAASVVDFVQGFSRADQQEVDVNRVAVYLNLAAVHMALGHFGMAASYCDKALELNPRSTKALLRRSRCHTARHDYEAAAADLAHMRRLDPASLEAEEQAVALQRTRAADKRKEQELFGHMFAARQAA